MDGSRARAVLGVGHHATADAVRRAFRARAKDCHPDRGGDRDAFEELWAAYSALRRHAAVAARPNPFAPANEPVSTWQTYDSPRPRRARRRPRFEDVLRDAMAG